jgi:hypothetical protein
MSKPDDEHAEGQPLDEADWADRHFASRSSSSRSCAMMRVSRLRNSGSCRYGLPRPAVTIAALAAGSVTMKPPRLARS